ncbi:hypothetical protein C8F01DRAFT_1080776 [Mycena amicta]|nr:hypothetical protein C8F01DRAFT_1080776 [Mycena amicta]
MIEGSLVVGGMDSESGYGVQLEGQVHDEASGNSVGLRGRSESDSVTIALGAMGGVRAPTVLSPSSVIHNVEGTFNTTCVGLPLTVTIISKAPAPPFAPGRTVYRVPLRHIKTNLKADSDRINQELAYTAFAFHSLACDFTTTIVLRMGAPRANLASLLGTGPNLRPVSRSGEGRLMKGYRRVLVRIESNLLAVEIRRETARAANMTVPDSSSESRVGGLRGQVNARRF